MGTSADLQLLLGLGVFLLLGMFISLMIVTFLEEFRKLRRK